MEETKRYIDSILSDPQKTYDDAMKPVLEGKAETSFKRAILNGQEVIFNLEKAKAEMCYDLDDLDVDTLIDAELAIKDQEEKLKMIKEQYKKWFGVDYK